MVTLSSLAAQDGMTRASLRVSSSFTLAVAIDCRNDPREADEERRPAAASEPAPAHTQIHTYIQCTTQSRIGHAVTCSCGDLT